MLATASGTPSRADVIYLCENESSVVVRSGASQRDAREAACVAQWQEERRREAIAKRSAGALKGQTQAKAGASSRDFCVPGEPCHLPLPRWHPRWDYEPSGRHIYARFWFD